MTTPGSCALSAGTREAPDCACKESNLLNLDFSPEQEMLRTTVRGLVGSACPITTVRELEDDPTGYPPILWKQLARAGSDRTAAS